MIKSFKIHYIEINDDSAVNPKSPIQINTDAQSAKNKFGALGGAKVKL